MIEAAEAGDKEAKVAVERYQYRPAVEFYDVIEDPLEMRNLAEDPEYADEIAGLRKELDRWMQSQGDQGVATELVANQHKRPKAKSARKNKRKKEK